MSGGSSDEPKDMLSRMKELASKKRAEQVKRSIKPEDDPPCLPLFQEPRRPTVPDTTSQKIKQVLPEYNTVRMEIRKSGLIGIQARPDTPQGNKAEQKAFVFPKSTHHSEHSSHYNGHKHEKSRTDHRHDRSRKSLPTNERSTADERHKHKSTAEEQKHLQTEKTKNERSSSKNHSSRRGRSISPKPSNPNKTLPTQGSAQHVTNSHIVNKNKHSDDSPDTSQQNQHKQSVSSHTGHKLHSPHGDGGNEDLSHSTKLFKSPEVRSENVVSGHSQTCVEVSSKSHEAECKSSKDTLRLPNGRITPIKPDLQIKLPEKSRHSSEAVKDVDDILKEMTWHNEPLTGIETPHKEEKFPFSLPKQDSHVVQQVFNRKPAEKFDVEEKKLNTPVKHVEPKLVETSESDSEKPEETTTTAVPKQPDLPVRKPAMSSANESSSSGSEDSSAEESGSDSDSQTSDDEAKEKEKKKKDGSVRVSPASSPNLEKSGEETTSWAIKNLMVEVRKAISPGVAPVTSSINNVEAKTVQLQQPCGLTNKFDDSNDIILDSLVSKEWRPGLPFGSEDEDDLVPRDVVDGSDEGNQINTDNCSKDETNEKFVRPESKQRTPLPDVIHSPEADHILSKPNSKHSGKSPSNVRKNGAVSDKVLHSPKYSSSPAKNDISNHKVSDSERSRNSTPKSGRLTPISKSDKTPTSKHDKHTPKHKRVKSGNKDRARKCLSAALLSQSESESDSDEIDVVSVSPEKKVADSLTNRSDIDNKPELDGSGIKNKKDSNDDCVKDRKVSTPSNQQCWKSDSKQKTPNSQKSKDKFKREKTQGRTVKREPPGENDNKCDTNSNMELDMEDIFNSVIHELLSPIPNVPEKCKPDNSNEKEKCRSSIQYDGVTYSADGRPSIVVRLDQALIDRLPLKEKNSQKDANRCQTGDNKIVINTDLSGSPVVSQENCNGEGVVSGNCVQSGNVRDCPEEAENLHHHSPVLTPDPKLNTSSSSSQSPHSSHKQNVVSNKKPSKRKVDTERVDDTKRLKSGSKSGTKRPASDLEQNEEASPKEAKDALNVSKPSPEVEDNVQSIRERRSSSGSTSSQTSQQHKQPKKIKHSQESSDTELVKFEPETVQQNGETHHPPNSTPVSETLNTEAVHYPYPAIRVSPPQTQEESLESADVYLGKAKELKHEADKLKDKLTRAVMYTEAVLSFIQCGNAMEKDQISGSTKIFTMFAETLKLISHICHFRSSHQMELSDKERKLSVLSLRIQSLLNLKLYKLKKDESLKLKRIIDDHNKTSSTKHSTPGHAPSPHQTLTGLINRTTDTPWPMSPTPSPAGSIGSVGSQGSACDLTPSKLPNGNVGPSSAGHTGTVTVPQRIHSITQQYLTHTSFLVQCHSFWDQADAAMEDHRDFFLMLDRDGGSLSLQSSLQDLVRYVQRGVHSLRDT